MSMPSIVYDACRAYVVDNVDMLSASTLQTVQGWIRSRQYQRLARLRESLDFSNISVEEHRVIMQIESFFRKNSDFVDDEVCTDAARSTFVESELRCHYTNERFDAYASGAIDGDLEFLYNRAKSWIQRILGPYEEFVEELPQLLKLTSGATATASRSLSQPVRKIGQLGSCTPKAWPYIVALYRAVGEEPPRPKLTLRNRVAVVPKDWKTHRTIAAEPAGNLPLQLAFDAFGKKCLSSRTDIDLANQSGNRDLARLGSLEDGTWCTVDLSAASDTIAMNLVAYLLPDDWFGFLNDVRSPGFTGVFGDGEYAKFSSMGNGTTFVLETLIFASLCYAVGAKQYLVYGDDIVIDKAFYQPLVDLLGDAGFQINRKKSFSEGPFRESCGGNYHSGFDITPFYWRRTPRCKAEWCHIVNGLAGVARPGGNLSRLLKDIVLQERLPMGPYATSTTCWVHLDASTAYREGVIKSDRHTFGCRVRGYVARPQKRSSSWSFRLRKYYLWHFRRLATSGFDDDSVFSPPVALLGRFISDGTFRYEDPFIRLPVQTSREPITRAPEGYKVKWVSWFPPASETPAHLYWWSDWLVRVS